MRIRSNASWFLTLVEAKHKIEAWRQDYNRERPHSSLGYQAPEEFARRHAPSPSNRSIAPDARRVKATLTGELRSALTRLRSGARSSYATAMGLAEVLC